MSSAVQLVASEECVEVIEEKEREEEDGTHTQMLGWFRKEMWKMLNNDMLTDVVVKVPRHGGGEGDWELIKAHRVVLAAASPVMKTMLTSTEFSDCGKGVLQLKDLDGQAMRWVKFPPRTSPCRPLPLVLVLRAVLSHSGSSCGPLPEVAQGHQDRHTTQSLPSGVSSGAKRRDAPSTAARALCSCDANLQPDPDPERVFLLSAHRFCILWNCPSAWRRLLAEALQGRGPAASGESQRGALPATCLPPWSSPLEARSTLSVARKRRATSNH